MLIWNPGDDTDLFEGGTGIDTAEVNGGNGTETFTVTANGSRVRFDRVDPAPFALDIGTTENLVLNMNGGDDIFSASGNLSPLIQITVDGGAGNDTIGGSNGPTSSWAEMATTASMETRGMTSLSLAQGTICSSGILVMAATPLKGRPGLTP